MIRCDAKIRFGFVNTVRHHVATLLFDWDGTLFESAGRGLAAFQKTFADLGIPFDLELYEACYSPNWYLMYEALKLPKQDWERADELWLEHYGEETASLVEGAADTLIELQKRDYRLGLVSSGSERRVVREVERSGLGSTFQVVICNEQMVNKKPHPEGLETAMRFLGSRPETCSYIGDAPEDIQMGRNARVLTVGVRSAYPTSRLLIETEPDIHIERIRELLLHFRGRV
jgi:HAD superfamily hydrolase (TIGR01549 family)